MGFWAPLKALKLIITSPRILVLVLIPLAVNIGLYVIFFMHGSHALNDAVMNLLGHHWQGVPPWLFSISNIVLKTLGWLVLGLIAALSFTFVSGLISAPFNDLLSRAALRQYRKQKSLPEEGQAAASLSPGQTMMLEFKRMIVLILGAVAAAIIGLIPLMQLPALALGASLVSFEYFGYPVSHRSSNLFAVLGFTLRHPAVSLGFGTFLLLMMAVPFASLVYIPLAVVGATLLYAELTTALSR